MRKNMVLTSAFSKEVLKVQLKVWKDRLEETNERKWLKYHKLVEDCWGSGCGCEPIEDNPNMTCQAVPLQSQSMVSNQQDHDPPSRPERHSSPQSPSTATHHEPPPRSWSNAHTHTRCQRDTGSATTTTISPHDTESATLNDH
ncbi:unnamed protein product [Pleuronectes platessa]|uniref:Uncharacterized protein n=1 Tax=Pleuronectes platessa TaxID=8262 RepID=A0A9N7TMQ4_PLEPL|nr:unnamed protein product [Pleuronectes platessa]